MNKNTSNDEWERRFKSRYIHTGYDPYCERECDLWRHPLEGCTGYFVKCYNMSTAGDDAIFVPDMSYEMFCKKMLPEYDEEVFTEIYDLFTHYYCKCEVQKAMLRKYVCDLMPIHRTSRTDFIPAILVDSLLELEEYSTYQELFEQGEQNPLRYIKEQKQIAERLTEEKPRIKVIDGVPYGMQSPICTWKWQIENLPFAKIYHMENEIWNLKSKQ